MLAVAPCGPIARADDAPYEIEIVRGTETERVTMDSRANDERIEVQNDVEKVYGVERGTGRIAVDTERYSMGASERQEVRRDIRQLIRLYESQLGLRVARDFEVQLEILGDDRSYERREGSAVSSLGFYRHDTREAIISGKGSRKDTRTTLVHESSHAVLMSQIPDVPKWLNAGLAEYFETLARGEGRARISGQQARHAALRSRLRQGRLVEDLGAFLQLDGRAWQRMQPEQRQTSYTLGWSLVHFLMDDASSRDVLAEVLADLADGAGNDPGGIAALERHYPGGVQRLEQDWRRWLGGASRDHVY